MGQQLSQPKLSAEVTRNRLREVCLRDDKMSPQLKNFNIKLLVNDLNALGFNIQTVGSNGRSLSNEQLCQTIRKKTIPSVENVCMIDGKSSKDSSSAIHEMAKHFNEYYGARISVLRNPLDPTQGKRNIADICDDLYLVSDKINRNLSDRPGVIKEKLKKEIEVLKTQKIKLDKTFSSNVISLERSMNQDKVQKDLDLSTKLYKIISVELANQLRFAQEGYASIGDIVNKETDQELNTLMSSNGNASPLESDMKNLGNLLSDYRKYRFSNDENSREKKIQLLLGVLKTLPTAVDSCEGCIKKFGMKVEDYMNSNIEVLQPQLRERFLALMKQTDNKNKPELMEISKCYKKLLDDRESCKRSGVFASNLGQGKGVGFMGDIRTAAAIVTENYFKNIQPHQQQF